MGVRTITLGESRSNRAVLYERIIAKSLFDQLNCDRPSDSQCAHKVRDSSHASAKLATQFQSVDGGVYNEVGSKYAHFRSPYRAIKAPYYEDEWETSNESKTNSFIWLTPWYERHSMRVRRLVSETDTDLLRYLGRKPGPSSR